MTKGFSLLCRIRYDRNPVSTSVSALDASVRHADYETKLLY